MSDLVLLSLSLLTWGFGEGMFLYFQPIYMQQLGANTMTIATVFSLFGFAMMVAHIPAGYLSDRIGRKPLLLVSWVTGMAAAWVMAAARSLPVFVVGALLYGLTAFVSSPLNSYVTAGRGRLSPGRAMTLVSAAYNLGAVLGPVTGGWIGEHYGLRSVYMVSACVFIVSTIVLFFLRGQPVEAHDTAAPPARLWENPRFVGFLGLIFVVVFVLYLPQPLAPKFLQNERGLSLESIGLLGSIGSLGNTVLALTLGQLAARTGYLLGQVLVAAFCVLIWQGSGLPWYALGYFLLGGFRSVRALTFAQIRPLIHPAQMGLAYGVAETFSSLALVLAPLLAGVLYTRDPVLVYPVAIGLVAVTLVLTGLFAPREQAKEEAPAITLPPEL
jgi:MFS family permease